jgi:hypothetical protein
MADKKVIELEVESNLGSLRGQLQKAQREVYQMSEAFGATSKEAAQAALKAAELKDAIADAKALTDAFNPDAKFNALSTSIGGALNGFQAFEGALGVMGVESKDLEKTLLKVQSAMALSQGIQGALEAKDSFIQLGAVVKNAFSTMTTASKAFLVGGLGLIIAAVGILVANYDEWFGVSKDVAEQQKIISNQSKEQRENIAKESGEFATLISRLKNTNEGSKERADLIKKINGQYGTTLQNIKDEAKFQESLNKELASYLEYQKAKYQLQKNEELIVKNLEKQDEIQSKITKAQKELPALIEAQKKAQKGLNETNANDSNLVAFYAEKVREAKEAVAAKNREIKFEQDELEKAEKRFNAYGSAANNASEKVDKLTNSGSKYVEQNNKEVDSNKKVEKSLKEKVQTEEEAEALRTAIIVKWNQDALDKKKASEEEYAEWKKAYDEDQRKWEEDWNQKKIDAAKVVAETMQTIRMQDISNIQNGINLISNLFEGNKKVQAAALIAQNAVSIAKTIIETKAANQAARAQGASLAVYTAGASTVAAEALVLRNNIGAGISIAAIAAATGKGLQALGKGGTPQNSNNTDTGGGGGGTVMSPNFNIVGNSGMNQLAQLQQQPTKAYVVSGDMTTAQALDRNRIENATLVQ